MTDSWTLTLPFTAPPLHANQRLHWAAKANLTHRIRSTTATLARNAGIPPLGRCDVTLHWAPRDRRVRDAENPVPTYKAICDGLVDAGVVDDDRPELMTKHMPIITTPERPARMWLTIRKVELP